MGAIIRPPDFLVPVVVENRDLTPGQLMQHIRAERDNVLPKTLARISRGSGERVNIVMSVLGRQQMTDYALTWHCSSRGLVPADFYSVSALHMLFSSLCNGKPFFTFFKLPSKEILYLMFKGDAMPAVLVSRRKYGEVKWTGSWHIACLSKS